MGQEQRVQDMHSKYQTLSQAYRKLEHQFQQLNHDYDVKSSENDELERELQSKDEMIDNLCKHITMLEKTVAERKAELQMVTKSIEIAKQQQLSESQRADADQQYLAAIDRYLYSDTFITEFLKSLGKRKITNKFGGVTEKEVYVDYVERRERRRNRALADQENYRRPLPASCGDGGDGTSFRQPEGEDEFSF